MKTSVGLAALVVVMVEAGQRVLFERQRLGRGTGPACHTTVAGTSGSAVTVAAPGTSDCTPVAQFPGDRFPGYTVTPTATKGTGNAVCQGMPGGEYRRP